MHKFNAKICPLSVLQKKKKNFLLSVVKDLVVAGLYHSEDVLLLLFGEDRKLFYLRKEAICLVKVP